MGDKPAAVTSSHLARLSPPAGRQHKSGYIHIGAVGGATEGSDKRQNGPRKPVQKAGGNTN